MFCQKIQKMKACEIYNWQLSDKAVIYHWLASAKILFCKVISAADEVFYKTFTKQEVDAMMPLILAAAGETNTIRKVSGNPEVKKHLEDLGFVVGGEVTVVSAIGGNLIVNVKESRIAISREMAGKIMV